MFSFSIYPNLHGPGSAAAAGTAPFLRVDGCLPASLPITVRPLIYNAEPKKQGLRRPDHHLAFGVHLVKDEMSRVDGPPHLGLCCVIV